MKTASKPEIAIHTIERQNASAMDPIGSIGTFTSVGAIEKGELERAMKVRRSDPDMLSELYHLMSQPALRTSLLYLLIIIRDHVASLGRHLTMADILQRCRDGQTPQVKRWIKHLLKEAVEAGLIERDEPNGEHRIQDTGHLFIQQAAVTRMALWRINPRMPASQIHAIVVEEEYDHPLHYNTNMQKHVIQPMDGLPSPRRTGKQGVRRDKPAAASNASSFSDPFHTLAAATGAWSRG